MSAWLDAMWRAGAYCLHPRVVVWSLLPLVLMVAVAFGAGWFFWEPAMDAVAAALDSWSLVDAAHRWLASVGMSGLKAVLPPLIVLSLATPVIVVLSLLAVATLMTPAMVRFVAGRRFPNLALRHGGSFVHSLVGGLAATVLALVAIVVSMPFWLVPPLVVVLPPLIWGWLTYRVMSYDVLADHASADERRVLMRRHRLPLFGVGVVTGYLGAAPSIVWASGWVFVAAAPLLIPVAIWIYTLVFAFSALWFAHYALAALQALRAEAPAAPVTGAPFPPPAAGDPPAALPPL